MRSRSTGNMCRKALKEMSQTSPIFGIPWIILISFAVAASTYVFVDAHADRPADLRARIEPVGGAAARHRRRQGDDACLHDLGRAGGACRHPVREPMGLRESRRTPAPVSSFRSSPPWSSAACRSMAASARCFGAVLGVLLLGASPPRCRCSAFPARRRARSTARVILVALLIDQLVRRQARGSGLARAGA